MGKTRLQDYNWVPEQGKFMSLEEYLRSKMKWYHQIMWYSWLTFSAAFLGVTVDYLVNDQRTFESHNKIWIALLVLSLLITVTLRTILGNTIETWKIEYSNLSETER